MRQQLSAMMVAIGFSGLNVAHAEDCSRYVEMKRNAAMNLNLLYQLDAEEKQCWARQRAPQPQVNLPPGSVYRALEAPPPLPPADPLVVRAFGEVEKLTQSGRNGLYGSDSLSTSLARNNSSASKAVRTPQGYNDPYARSEPAPASTLSSTSDPFGTQHFEASQRPQAPTASQGVTMQPPAGYNDPFQSAGPPGSRGVYSNCTFNSPSCR
jgi:hypothetical protein